VLYAAASDLLIWKLRWWIGFLKVTAVMEMMMIGSQNERQAKKHMACHKLVQKKRKVAP
jgi:hypothetical protein